MVNRKKIFLILIIFLFACEHKKFKNPVDPNNYPPAPILISPANDILIPENPLSRFHWQIKEDSTNVLFGEPMDCKLEIATDENFSNAESIIIPFDIWEPYSRFFGDSTYYWRVSTRYRGGIWGEPSEIFSFRVKFPIINETEFNGLDFEIKDNYLLLADDSNSIKIFDITDPAAPIYLRKFDPPNFSASFLFLNDRYLYTIDRDYGGSFCIIDINDPLDPLLLTKFNTPNSEKFWVSGNRAYIVYGWKIKVLDVTNPESVYLVDSLGGFDIRDIAVKNNYLYLLSSYGFYIIDLNYDSIISTLDIYSGNQFYLDGDYAYIISSEFNIVNIADPLQPIIEATLDLLGNFVYKKDNFVFIGPYPGENLLKIFDVTDIRSPITCGQIKMSNCVDLVVENDKIICISPLRIFKLWQN
ncbi:MAG: hypothetical protein OEZ20_03980 [candidate division WOR-3 bacterium]|nr:hypothetical protein [candidate division WOR-3 bacterium]MDH5683605.1 hypothetical protein [candidate division WOR-3 bacterium]